MNLIQRMLLLLVFALIATPSISDVNVKATLTSEYLFRGVVQGDDKPAFQLGVDYLWGEQNYVGVWGSRVETQEKNNIEFNYYIGKLWDLNGVKLNTGFVYYDYRHTDTNSSARELFLEVYWERLVFSLHEDLEDEPTQYVSLSMDQPFLWDTSARAHLGRQFYSSNGPSAYTDLSLTLGRELKEGISLGLQFIDTRGLDSDEEHWVGYIRVEID